MDNAEREGRRDELRKRFLEAVLAGIGAMVVLTIVMWVCANWSR